MLVTLIVAMSENRAIGRDNRLPWHLAADLAQFKRLTMGHHLVMGRKTYESIGRPLPGREMIVVTRQEGYAAPGCAGAPSLEAALALARARGEGEAFVIGGAELFAAALPLAGRMYLTLVHAQVEADAFFPAFDEAGWVELSSWPHPADARNEFPFTFVVRERA